MTDLTRDEQLVRASKARAAITGFLSQQAPVAPVTQDKIQNVVDPLDMTSAELSNMLYRMAADGLIAKYAVEHAHYRVGYSALELGPTAKPKREYTKKPQAATEGAPIDVRVNEREGIITIRYAGMVLSFSKE